MIAIAISLVSFGRAAEVILREQATLEGSIVRLGDIADLSAVDPALAARVRAAGFATISEAIGSATRS